MTNREVLVFNATAQRWQHMHSAPSKLNYALARMLKRTARIVEKFEEALEDARIENCLTEEKTGAILTDERGAYKFTKEGSQKVNEVRRDLLNKEVEFEPYIAKEVPVDLPDDVRSIFEGFVILPDEND